MKRYTFHFVDQGNVQSDIVNEQEQQRIQSVLDSDSKFLDLPGSDTQVRVYIRHVKAVVTEILKPVEEADLQDISPQLEAV